MNQHVSSGVWGRSTPAAYEDYIIFCVGQNPVKIAAFKSWATGRFGFKSLIGCYKGQMEQSFIVNAKHFPEIAEWTNGEESILHLASNPRGVRKATLKYLDGREESLGYFTAVGRDRAMSGDSWTFDPTSGEYYVCQ